MLNCHYKNKFKSFYKTMELFYISVTYLSGGGMLTTCFSTFVISTVLARESRPGSSFTGVELIDRNLSFSSGLPNSEK